MAVTPEEAAKINDAAERKAVEEMEATIDGLLNAQYRTGTSVHVPMSTIKQAGGDGYSERAWLEVKRRFQTVGWQIKKKTENGYMAGTGFNFSAVAQGANQGGTNCLHELR